MVKTDWNNIEGITHAVAKRFVDALKNPLSTLAVSLTAMGSDVRGKRADFPNAFTIWTKS